MVPKEHSEEHDAGSPHVRGHAIVALVRCYLRRHIGRRAAEDPHALRGFCSESEVDDFADWILTFLHEDHEVLRFEVSVCYALLVEAHQGFNYLAEDFSSGLFREEFVGLLVQYVLQDDALHVL